MVATGKTSCSATELSLMLHDFDLNDNTQVHSTTIPVALFLNANEDMWYCQAAIKMITISITVRVQCVNPLSGLKHRVCL